MKNIIVYFFLVLVTGFMSGCEKIGYMVTVTTKKVGYDDLQNIGKTLEEKGYKIVIWERKEDMPKYPGEVYTLFEKKLSHKAYHIVEVFLIYAKDVQNNIAHDLRIDVSNVYKGMTITELKDEIDKIGNMIYKEVVNRSGKENVVIERKEIQHRVIF